MEKSRKPVHPGNVFMHDVLAPLGLTVTDAAQMQMALRIAKVTCTSAESWLAMQVKLDLWKARQKKLETLQEFPKKASVA